MIRLDKEGGLWTITIERPDKANSLSEAMLTDLAGMAEAAQTAEDIRALVITGTGTRVFSAGADLEEAKAGLATSLVWERVSGAIAEIPCLTVAALNGTLAGGAFGMALACDIRIAVPEAKFFYPVAKLGYLPQPSDPKRMTALIGPARTKLILLASQKIGAEEAVNWGLVDRIVASDHLMTAVRELVRASIDGNPVILRGIKSLCS